MTSLGLSFLICKMEYNYTCSNKDRSLSPNEIQIYEEWAHQKLVGIRINAALYLSIQPSGISPLNAYSPPVRKNSPEKGE